MKRYQSNLQIPQRNLYNRTSAELLVRIHQGRSRQSRMEKCASKSEPHEPDFMDQRTSAISTGRSTTNQKNSHVVWLRISLSQERCGPLSRYSSQEPSSTGVIYHCHHVLPVCRCHFRWCSRPTPSRKSVASPQLHMCQFTLSHTIDFRRQHTSKTYGEGFIYIGW